METWFEYGETCALSLYDSCGVSGGIRFVIAHCQVVDDASSVKKLRCFQRQETATL